MKINLTLGWRMTEQTEREGGMLLLAASRYLSMQTLRLDKEAPEEQNAQDYQNRDDDYLDQAHSGFLKVKDQ